MKDISIGKVFLAGILYTIVAQIVHSIGAALSMKYYLIEKYFPVWSKLMMPSAGPPPASFMMYSIAFGLIGGILISLVYGVIKDGIPGDTLANKGLVYGLLLFLVAGIPGSLALTLLINLPAMLIVVWAVEGLIIYLLNGMIIAKINP